MRTPRVVPWILSAVTVIAATPAHAFENQWHLGVGAGIAHYDRAAALAPALGVHGAYGLSDSFDARLELMTSWHASDPIATALLGATYKLDVIQLIPWGGLAIGGYYLGDRWSGRGRNTFEPGAAALFGLDYAWSRQWGLSFATGIHFMPLAEDKSAITPRYITAMLRIEHRWGW